MGCYSTRGKQFGTFPLNHEGFLVAIKLEHVRGHVTCNRGQADYYNSNWGCNAGGDMGITNEHIGTFITDDKNDVIFPGNSGEGMAHLGQAYYKAPGFKGDSKELVFGSYCRPMYARRGQVLRIWYGEDLYKATREFPVRDNGGLHCVKVYAKFL